ncbi:MAG TPA: GAF domain-containing protein [Rhizobium sp.]
MQEAFVSNLPFEEFGEHLCQQVGAIAPDIIPSIILVDRERKNRLWAVSMVPKEYGATINGLTIGEAVGSCGTAAARGEKVLCNDMEHDPLWIAYAHLALAHGLRACWSYPIKARDGRVIGAFAFRHAHQQRCYHERWYHGLP